MINSQDIKKGTAIRMDGAIWVCIDFQHRKPGKSAATTSVKSWRTLSSSTATTSISMRIRKVVSS